MSEYSSFHTILSVREIQRFLNKHLRHLVDPLKIDGILGDKTWKALMDFVHSVGFDGDRAFKSWKRDRKYIAAQQLILEDLDIDPGTIDGYIGPATNAAVEKWQNTLLDPRIVRDPEEKNPWPYERDCLRFYGKIGTNHTALLLPYPVKLTWNPSTVLKRISVNKRCSESLERVLSAVREHYGDSGVNELGLNLFSGCYNPRKKRGGSSWSMHAYACALDFYDTKNRYRWHADQALFARPEYDKWWEAWEREHWISLGRERNFDWMHVQAAKI